MRRICLLALLACFGFVAPQQSRAQSNRPGEQGLYAVHERAKKEGSDFEPTVSVSTSRRDGQLEIKVADNEEGKGATFVVTIPI